MDNQTEVVTGELMEIDANTALAPFYSTHGNMIRDIKTNLPAINKDMSIFGKTQSQFMDVMMTVSHPTPIRNLRQISAQINRTMSALQEAGFNIRKKQIQAEIKQKEATEFYQIGDELHGKLSEVEAEELLTQIKSTEMYISGAIRKVKNYIDQYQSILQKIGKTELTEDDFEQEEARYHVMRAFQQALSAARSRGGTIDEGNFIYFQQIGVNGSVAQKHVRDFLIKEEQLIKNATIVENGRSVLKVDLLPSATLELEFLNKMGDLYQKNALQLCEAKGMTLINNSAMLRLEAKGE